MLPPPPGNLHWGSAQPTYEAGCGALEPVEGRLDMESSPCQCLDAAWRVAVPPSAAAAICENTCLAVLDSNCDDGGAGSEFSLCLTGTDCADCGPRTHTSADDFADEATTQATTHSTAPTAEADGAVAITQATRKGLDQEMDTWLTNNCLYTQIDSTKYAISPAAVIACRGSIHNENLSPPAPPNTGLQELPDYAQIQHAQMRGTPSLCCTDFNDGHYEELDDGRYVFVDEVDDHSCSSHDYGFKITITTGGVAPFARLEVHKDQPDWASLGNTMRRNDWACNLPIFPAWELVVDSGSDAGSDAGVTSGSQILLVGNPDTCPCFARSVATACRLHQKQPRRPPDAAAAVQAYADCFDDARNSSGVAERVLMSTLAVGDVVLAQDADSGALYTDVIVHTSDAGSDEAKALLTLHHTAGALTITPTHELWADGAMVAARGVAAGATLRHAHGNVTVERVSATEGAVVNPVVCGDRILAADGMAGLPALATTMAKALGDQYVALCGMGSSEDEVLGDVV